MVCHELRPGLTWAIESEAVRVRQAEAVFQGNWNPIWATTVDKGILQNFEEGGRFNGLQFCYKVCRAPCFPTITKIVSEIFPGPILAKLLSKKYRICQRFSGWRFLWRNALARLSTTARSNTNRELFDPDCVLFVLEPGISTPAANFRSQPQTFNPNPARVCAHLRHSAPFCAHSDCAWQNGQRSCLYAKPKPPENSTKKAHRGLNPRDQRWGANARRAAHLEAKQPREAPTLPGMQNPHDDFLGGSKISQFWKILPISNPGIEQTLVVKLESNHQPSQNHFGFQFSSKLV